MHSARARARLAISIAVVAAVVLSMGAGPASAALPAPKPPSAAAMKKLGVRVVWPAGRRVMTVEPGERLHVRVRRAGGATPRVTLVRVDSRGRRMRQVGTDAGRRGVLSVTVPERAGARYALQLQVGPERFWSWLQAQPAPEPVVAPPPLPAPEPPLAPAPPPPPPLAPAPSPAPPSGPGGPPVYSHPGLPCPASGGTASATHSLDRVQARAGERVQVTITNTGDTCLYDELDSYWERQLVGGGWERVSEPAWHPGTPDAPERVESPRQTEDRYIGMMGASWTVSIPVWSSMHPGRYRLTKSLGGVNGPWVIQADFVVLPD